MSFVTHKEGGKWVAGAQQQFSWIFKPDWFLKESNQTRAYISAHARIANIFSLRWRGDDTATERRQKIGTRVRTFMFFRFRVSQDIAPLSHNVLCPANSDLSIVMMFRWKSDRPFRTNGVYIYQQGLLLTEKPSCTLHFHRSPKANFSARALGKSYFLNSSSAFPSEAEPADVHV